MTQLDPGTRERRRRRRSWRDLPASPPVTDQFPNTAPVATTLEIPNGQVDTTEMPGVAPPPPPPQPLAPPPVEQTGRRRVGWWIAGAAAVFVAIAGVVLWSGGDAETTPTVAPVEAGNPASVAEALGPAVVQIELFGGLDAGGGVGSGVIYDTTGLVLTAHHVVAFNDEVTVRLADEREYTGRVVGRAPERDLAIVALDSSTDLTAATIAEPGSVEVGEPAFALGSPFGFQQSVTAGIISGLDRELDTPVGLLTGLIQTDAPINPGNSGGPLADAEAKVIGINTAIASMSGGNDGVGFAVPVEDFAELLDEVEANGGIDAPTIPAPEDAGGLGGLLPGIDQLPGLGEALDQLLEEFFGPGGAGDPNQLPGMDQLLEDMLDELFGANGGATDPNQAGIDQLFDELLRPVPSQQDLDDLPTLDELLNELFGTDAVPSELDQLLNELFGVPGSNPTPEQGTQP